MVRYSTIIDIIDKSLNKCHDYPKARALDYFKANQDNFANETYDYGDNPNQLPSPQGHLQRIQEELQEDVEYTDLETGTIYGYQTNNYIELGIWLNTGQMPKTPNEIREVFGGLATGYMLDENGNYMNRWERGDEQGTYHSTILSGLREDDTTPVRMTLEDQDKHLTSAINKTPPLQQDTVLYSYRELPADIQVGDHGTFRGYSSCTYNPFVVDDIKQGGPWVVGEENRRYKVKIYAPFGTKGMVVGETTSTNLTWQSEWLLGKNQRYIVWSKNDNDMTAEIILY